MLSLSVVITCLCLLICIRSYRSDKQMKEQVQEITRNTIRDELKRFLDSMEA